MKKTNSRRFLLFASCLLSVQGTGAETKWYIDSGQNTYPGSGVVGAEYTGSQNFGTAIYGHAAGSFGGLPMAALSSAIAQQVLGSMVGLERNLAITLAATLRAPASQAKEYMAMPASKPRAECSGVYGKSASPNGYGVYSDGNMMCTANQIVGGNQLVKGNQTVNGTKSAVVKLKNGEGVSLYAVEASENWFEDFGSAKLKDGAAVVAIDPLYAETVNTEIDYHVFLTPRGECKGLYVTNQKGSSFEVRELNGGKSDIPFSYRIVAKRKGYEDVRLAKVKEEMVAALK